MGVPVKLVMALVIGVMSMGVLMHFVDTAKRTVLKDMRVDLESSGNELNVEVYDAASGDPIKGAMIIVKYPGGTRARALAGTNGCSFRIPLNNRDVVVATVEVRRHGYIPWEGQAAIPGS